MWDKTYGGFYNLVDRKGTDKSNPLAPKEAYGNAFAIYALAAYYKASQDTAALGLVKKAFSWLEKHSHDPVYKGYYQHLTLPAGPHVIAVVAPGRDPLILGVMVVPGRIVTERASLAVAGTMTLP